MLQKHQFVFTLQVLPLTLQSNQRGAIWLITLVFIGVPV